jgi:O-antigen/teichoic acid export membrane protein
MNLIARFARHKIARNTSVMMFAQLSGRFLTLFYVAALARYVGKVGIGQISTATTVNGILVLIVGPGLSTLLTRDVASDFNKAGTYLTNTFFLRLLLGLPFLIIVGIVSHVAGYPPDTIAIIYVYTAVYLIDALTEIVAATFQAYEHMEYVGGSEIARNLINVILSLIGIYLQWSLLAIALMSVVAVVCKLGILLAILSARFVRPRISLDFNLSKALLFSSAPFGVLLILHTGRSLFGTFIISLYYPAEVVGIYSAATFLIIVLQMIPGSFSKAIFPNFSSLHVHAPADLRRFYQICYKYLLVIGFPLGLGTMMVGDKAIMLIYGEEFASSAPVIRILGLFLFTIVGYSNGPLLNATGRQTFFAWTEGTAIGMNILLSILLVPEWGPIGAAMALVASGIGTFFVHSTACHRQLDLSLPWRTMGKTLLATLAMGIAIYFSLHWNIPWLLIVFPIAPLVYGAAILALRIVNQDELRLLAGGAPTTRQPLDTAGSSPT